jgi:hypothetical protein
MHSMTRILQAAFFVASLAGASLAAAEEAPPPAPAANLVEPEVLSPEDMASLSGGTGVEVVVITEGTLRAVNSGNSIAGDTIGSGQVEIGQGAFSGYAGLGNFVINTGHNNNLQSSMNVSVTLAPPPPAPGS